MTIDEIRKCSPDGGETLEECMECHDHFNREEMIRVSLFNRQNILSDYCCIPCAIIVYEEIGKQLDALADELPE